tara:strand:- start:4686 stop:4931 length:246 start_codon:yes stop_codon:yes gene_type:complete
MNDDEVTRKAKRDLKRVAEEGGLLSSPKLKAKSDSVIGHFQAQDADADDRVEVWGTRIGRILSLVAFIGLAFWLYFNHFSS